MGSILDRLFYVLYQGHKGLGKRRSSRRLESARSSFTGFIWVYYAFCFIIGYAYIARSFFPGFRNLHVYVTAAGLFAGWLIIRLSTKRRFTYAKAEELDRRFGEHITVPVARRWCAVLLVLTIGIICLILFLAQRS